MTVTDLYRQHYKYYCDTAGYFDDEPPSKYEWAASEVFDLCTYDSGLDEVFVKAIVEVCNAIYDRQTFEYIRDGSRYTKYILVCQLLCQNRWINWGTSIRGAWLEAESQSKDIIGPSEWWEPGDDGEMVKHEIEAVKFSKRNLMILIEFLEEEEYET